MLVTASFLIILKKAGDASLDRILKKDSEKIVRYLGR